MITATIAPYGLLVEGHARAGPYGQDIVCAAVSGLVQTFAHAIEEFTLDDVETITEPGRAVILWPRAPTVSLRLLIDSLWLGLCEIANSYSEYVTLRCVTE